MEIGEYNTNFHMNGLTNAFRNVHLTFQNSSLERTLLKTTLTVVGRLIILAVGFLSSLILCPPICVITIAFRHLHANSAVNS